MKLLYLVVLLLGLVGVVQSSRSRASKGNSSKVGGARLQQLPWCCGGDECFVFGRCVCCFRVLWLAAVAVVA